MMSEIAAVAAALVIAAFACDVHCAYFSIALPISFTLPPFVTSDM
jgi:hypothetical protein